MYLWVLGDRPLLDSLERPLNALRERRDVLWPREVAL